MLGQQKFSARNLRFSKRYLILGDGICFFDIISPKKGWRFQCESWIMRMTRFPSLRSKHLHQELRVALGSHSDFLLYNTSDYKDTRWIGVVKREKEAPFFIKVYKEQEIAEKNFRLSNLAKEHFSSIFRLSNPIDCAGRVLSFSLLKKAQNVSIEEVWTYALQQSLDLYHTGLDTQKWSTELQWVSKDFHFCKEVWGHGDLSHWNCFLDTEGRLCLIDYEELDLYPPFYDCFHLLLKPTLLHHSAKIPIEYCEEIAKAIDTSVIQVLVWLYLYLDIENKKDSYKNMLLKNEAIEKTIQNRKKTQEICKEFVYNFSGGSVCK